MSPDVLAAFAVLLTPLGALAAAVGMMYRKRIVELEATLKQCQERERRMLGVLVRGSEDEQQLAAELARVITGESHGH